MDYKYKFLAVWFGIFLHSVLLIVFLSVIVFEPSLRDFNQSIQSHLPSVKGETLVKSTLNSAEDEVDLAPNNEQSQSQDLVKGAVTTKNPTQFLNKEEKLTASDEDQEILESDEEGEGMRGEETNEESDQESEDSEDSEDLDEEDESETVSEPDEASQTSASSVGGLWDLIQNWRTSNGYSAYQQSDAVCELANLRGERVLGNLEGGLDPHKGFQEALDSWFEAYCDGSCNAAENVVNGHDSAGEALEAWLDSSGHRQNLEADYQYSCLREYPGVAVQIFANY